MLAGGDYPPLYPAIVMSSCFGVTIAAVVQRFPFANPWWVAAGLVFALTSLALDLIRPGAVVCGAPMIVGTACFLMTPVGTDVAPLSLALVTAIGAAMHSLRTGLIIAAVSATVIVVFGLVGNLASPAAYLLGVACGWLVGYMVLIQKRLADNQARVLRARADRAASDERRRIAREIHDVIAHSLSITMLNITAARHALAHGDDLPEALDALSDAERQGRQAMAEIRHIVHVLGADDDTHAPTPGADDLSPLVGDYRRAGIDIDYRMTGPVDRLPTPVGAALYRIVQESLSNVAKHSAAQRASVRIDVHDDEVTVRVDNPYTAIDAAPSADASGIRGMTHRARTLGGRLEVIAHGGVWSVRAVLPTRVVADQELTS